jgi:proline iminopeptidase
MLVAYHKRLTSPDEEVRRTAACAWSVWEGKTSYLLPNAEIIAKMSGDDFAIALARIECHYFINKGFFETETQLLDSVRASRHREHPNRSIVNTRVAAS